MEEKLFERSSRLNQNTVIIVGIVIYDSVKDSVVLIQESKVSCYGKWYIPAGKVEPNEDLISAGKREVKEETGLDVEIASVHLVENHPNPSFQWIRYCLKAIVIGGNLKTVEQKDEHSIQAQWFPYSSLNNGKLSLRGKDIIPLIDEVKDGSRKIIPPIVPIVEMQTDDTFSFDSVRVVLLDSKLPGFFVFKKSKSIFLSARLKSAHSESFVIAALRVLNDTYRIQSNFIGISMIEYVGSSALQGTRLTLVFQLASTKFDSEKLEFVSLESLKTGNDGEYRLNLTSQEFKMLSLLSINANSSTIQLLSL